MPTATPTDRQRPRATPRPAWRAARTIAATLTILMAPQIAVAQSRPPAATARHTPASTQPAVYDLQGLWDFEMRAGERTSPGFFALGPVEQQWAGSITMYLTNTLAIRTLTITGDSVRMVVASREGDVRLLARLTDNGRVMEGIVEYHGGALLPMTATRRLRPVVPR
ncbi:hypothetical protein [Gemmatimonas sp.]